MFLQHTLRRGFFGQRHISMYGCFKAAWGIRRVGTWWGFLLAACSGSRCQDFGSVMWTPSTCCLPAACSVRVQGDLKRHG